MNKFAAMPVAQFCARALALAGFVMLSSCASGGGGGGTPTPPTQPPTRPPPPPPPIVAAAARATKGSNTVPDVIATSSSSNFQSVMSGSVYPLTQSALALTATNVTVDNAVNSTGATLVLLFATNGDARLEIPALGVSANVDFSEGATLPDGREVAFFISAFNYVALGLWAVDAASGPNGTFAHYITGYHTPAANMPSNGTATYSGFASGTVLMENLTLGFVGGDAQLTANFGNSSVVGALNNMESFDPDTDATATWNNVSLQASILSGGAIQGTATATTAPGTPFALQAGATGFVDGRFYGPAANEIGAIWTLNDGKNTASGSLGAAKP